MLRASKLRRAPAAAWGVLRFELTYQLRRPSFWAVLLLFGGFGFADMWSNGSRGNAFFFVNSPSQLLQTTIWYTLFSVLAATAFVAEAFVRDARCGLEPLVLATPVRRWQLLGMRFIGAFAATVLAFSAYLPGMLLATQMPGLQAHAIGPLHWQAYAASWLGVALPNLWFVSVFAFAIASQTRSLVASFAGAIVLVMLYASALLLVGVEAVDYQQLAWWSLLDPYGHFALQSQTLSWTVHQHNTAMPPLDGALLHNRLLWLALGALTWGLAYWRFDMRPRQRWEGRRRGRAFGLAAAMQPPSAVARAWPAAIDPQPPGWRQLPRLVWLELLPILCSRSFQLLGFCGLVSLFFAAAGSRSFEHSNPSTDILVHSARLYFEQVLFCIVALYAAELAWRGRDAGLQAVIDATPLRTPLLVLAKLGALFALVSLNLALCLVVLALYQAAHGYWRFEPGLSATMLFVQHGPKFYFLAVLALLCQALVRQRYVGMALLLAAWLMHIPLDAMGLFHNLYRFGAGNDIGWSPMNGWAGLLSGHLWFVAYWAAVCTVLVCITCLVWPRGVQGGPGWLAWCNSLRSTWRQWSAAPRWLLAGAVAGSALLAGWIMWNTTVLNPWQPPGKELLAVNHERLFKRHEALPMPVVVATRLQLDLYPREGWFQARGRYTLENRSGQTIHQIHLSTFLGLELVEVAYPGARRTESHPQWGYHIYALDQPLAPGARAEWGFVTRSARPQGFRNEVDGDDVYMVAPNAVLGNGSSLYSPFILPFIGYTKMVEHKEAWLRAKHGLPPLDARMRAHEDPVGRARALTVSHLAWGRTDLTVSSDADQTIVSSGRLLRRWLADGRAHAQFSSQHSDRGKFTVYSARYDTVRDSAARVPIELYFDPGHRDHAQLMATHLRQAFTLYEQLFGPYPFAQVRLAEFAYYPGMVFSEGGTIGLPEVLGWKNLLDAPGEDAMLGWLAYLLGHAWWEDQLITADVAGSMSVREALSGYAANLYRRSIYTPERWQQTKQQQMRDYFRALGRVDFAEPPLSDVYNEVLVARYKGQMLLELIEWRIGQPALLAAIRSFTDRFRGQGPPYATVLDLRDAILQQTPPDLHAQVRQWFHQVVTYRFGLHEASQAQQPDGRWQLRLRVEASKLLTRGLGEQQASAFDQPLVLAMRDAQGRETGRLTLRPGQTGRPQVFLINRPVAQLLLDPDGHLPTASSPNRQRKVPVSPPNTGDAKRL